MSTNLYVLGVTVFVIICLCWGAVGMTRQSKADRFWGLMVLVAGIILAALFIFVFFPSLRWPIL